MRGVKLISRKFYFILEGDLSFICRNFLVDRSYRCILCLKVFFRVEFFSWIRLKVFLKGNIVVRFFKVMVFEGSYR